MALSDSTCQTSHDQCAHGYPSESNGADNAPVGKPLVAGRVVDAFVDCFAGREVLRTIDALFEDVGFALPDERAEAEAREDGRGMRRSRAIGYIATLDLSQPRDAALLTQAISIQLVAWEKDADAAYRQDLDRLLRNLDLSGFTWDGKRVVRRAGPVGASVFGERVGSIEIEDVNQEMERILVAVESDPADAITAARALVEAVCKAVLEELGEPVNEVDDLPSLYKKVAIALRVDPTQHDVVYRQTLQGLVSAVQGLAELRNRLGDAHGKGRGAVRPQARHARMAAGAAMTVAAFLVETLEARRTEVAQRT